MNPKKPKQARLPPMME